MALTKLNFGGNQTALVTSNIPISAGSIVKVEFAEIDAFGRTSLNTSSNVDIP